VHGSDADGDNRITSADLLTELLALDERPWKGFGKRNQPLTTRRLADLLRPYGISSNSMA
jgi:hypothetical protein